MAAGRQRLLKRPPYSPVQRPFAHLSIILRRCHILCFHNPICYNKSHKIADHQTDSIVQHRPYGRIGACRHYRERQNPGWPPCSRGHLHCHNERSAESCPKTRCKKWFSHGERDSVNQRFPYPQYSRWKGAVNNGTQTLVLHLLCFHINGNRRSNLACTRHCKSRI